MIQAKLINVSDSGMVDRVMGGIISGGVNLSSVNYVKENFKNLYNTATNVSRDFIKSIGEQVTINTDNSYLDRIKSVISDSGSFNENTISNLTLDNFTDMSFRDRQFMMLQPDIFEKNLSNTCSAFDGCYFDYDAEEKVLEHKDDYNRVIAGVNGFSTDEDDDSVVYYESSEQEDLDIFDKTKVLLNWELAKSFIDDGFDPTDEDLSDL